MHQEVEHVYLIGSAGSSVVKIGRSGDIRTRLQQIQRMSPAPLGILWSTPGGSAVEKALHRHFKALRMHGEWFDFSTDDPVTRVREALSVIVIGSEPLLRAVSRQSVKQRTRRRTRWMPVMKPGVVFARDPSGTTVSGWPKLSDAVDYYTPGPQQGSEARCWCGHQMGSHDSVRPHACGGDCQHGPTWSACLCLGYEGPLPVNLAQYDLPGQNWQLWRNATA